MLKVIRERKENVKSYLYAWYMNKENADNTKEIVNQIDDSHDVAYLNFADNFKIVQDKNSKTLVFCTVSPEKVLQGFYSFIFETDTYFNGKSFKTLKNQIEMMNLKDFTNYYCHSEEDNTSNGRCFCFDLTNEEVYNWLREMIKIRNGQKYYEFDTPVTENDIFDGMKIFE